MDANKLKRERGAAKGLFTKACNRLSEAININSEVDLIEAKFETLKIKWSGVQIKNDAYLSAVDVDGDGGDDIKEDGWIDDLEEKFEVVEKAKFDYVRKRKQNYEKDDKLIKHEVEEQLNKQKNVVDSKKKKSVRDMHGKVFRQEVKSLEELLDSDKDGSMKAQIEEAVKDVKLQLERCREAQMYYLDVSDTHIEDK